MTFFKKGLFVAIIVSLTFWLVECGEAPLPNHSAPTSKADSIVNEAIAYHGGILYDALDLSFTFREREMTVYRKGGVFAYTMTYADSNGTYLRKLTNEGFEEFLSGEQIVHNAKDSVARAASVNSVVYFALLPGILNDAAVIRKYAGEDVIEGKAYDRIEVRFTAEGGGEDFEDLYLYWFDKEDYSMDYLAYSYNTDEVGTRFRKAVDSRRINGLVVQDYMNYEGPDDPARLQEILELFKADSLEVLSEILIERVKVEPAK